jgi:hypothetical protein
METRPFGFGSAPDGDPLLVYPGATMTDDRRHDETPDDDTGDGTLGPGTTAGGGAVRAGERTDEGAAGERDDDAPRDREAARE